MTIMHKDDAMKLKCPLLDGQNCIGPDCGIAWIPEVFTNDEPWWLNLECPDCGGKDTLKTTQVERSTIEVIAEHYCDNVRVPELIKDVKIEGVEPVCSTCTSVFYDPWLKRDVVGKFPFWILNHDFGQCGIKVMGERLIQSNGRLAITK